MKRKRYCIPCDDYVVGKECPMCGADTDPLPRDGRERGDDDGREYSDPRDARDERL